MTDRVTGLLHDTCEWYKTSEEDDQEEEWGQPVHQPPVVISCQDSGAMSVVRSGLDGSDVVVSRELTISPEHDISAEDKFKLDSTMFSVVSIEDAKDLQGRVHHRTISLKLTRVSEEN